MDNGSNMGSIVWVQSQRYSNATKKNPEIVLEEYAYNTSKYGFRNNAKRFEYLLSVFQYLFF